MISLIELLLLVGEIDRVAKAVQLLQLLPKGVPPVQDDEFHLRGSAHQPCLHLHSSSYSWSSIVSYLWDVTENAFEI